MKNILTLCCIVALYTAGFIHIDFIMNNSRSKLEPAPPVKLLQSVTGFLRQITAEILFVKTSIFLGGRNIKPNEYASPLAQNLYTITSLYPDFIDPYYYTESFLAPISKKEANDANAILKIGINAHPNDFVLRFFYAFNYYQYLDQPLLAAKEFEKAAHLDGAPPMFSHLAAIFSVQGGNLQAGIVMLKTMLKGEKNKVVRKRYQEELNDLNKALAVEQAITSYIQEHNVPPTQLGELVPQYLDRLPLIKNRFILVYDPPRVFLKRPQKAFSTNGENH